MKSKKLNIFCFSILLIFIVSCISVLGEIITVNCIVETDKDNYFSGEDININIFLENVKENVDFDNVKVFVVDENKGAGIGFTQNSFVSGDLKFDDSGDELHSSDVDGSCLNAKGDYCAFKFYASANEKSKVINSKIKLFSFKAKSLTVSSEVKSIISCDATTEVKYWVDLFSDATSYVVTKINKEVTIKPLSVNNVSLRNQKITISVPNEKILTFLTTVEPILNGNDDTSIKIKSILTVFNIYLNDKDLTDQHGEYSLIDKNNQPVLKQMVDVLSNDGYSISGKISGMARVLKNKFESG